jgi:hypothetical protein
MNEPRKCCVEGCDRWLGHNNSSGYCQGHVEQRPDRKTRRTHNQRKTQEVKTND